MNNSKFFITAILLVILIIGLSACGNSSDDKVSIDNQIEDDEISESTDTFSSEPPNNTDKEVSTENENLQEDSIEDTVSKIEARKKEFIEKLDNIQKELDALPEKKDSDEGVTNAMKNYYGISYEMYDKALNEIYALLKEKLSPETMDTLKTEQIKWIEQKEDTANEERKKYEGGTFENVAYYISTYESTKERCYELVNEYMTD
ncbi:lysozyme inhibitor LprI family protein [Paenibacillus sp. FSL W7-1287]|uniref:lysozyme inhibitor LprI family protein n=1 Tax=Paenibacillus sp. FSL W7-1287 TaxID=2954538 RepID=UPI0030F98B33